MPDHTVELRERAAECLALAEKAVHPELRVGLLTLAQKLFHMARAESAGLGGFRRNPDDGRLSKH